MTSLAEVWSELQHHKAAMFCAQTQNRCENCRVILCCIETMDKDQINELNGTESVKAMGNIIGQIIGHHQSSRGAFHLTPSAFETAESFKLTHALHVKMSFQKQDNCHDISEGCLLNCRNCRRLVQSNR